MKSRLLLLCVVLVLPVAGCGGSFVGRRVDNFTAYYNTYYNAQKAFTQGTASLDDSNAPVDPDFYLPPFPGPEEVSSEQDFQKAIEKSADVLRDHPNSKWVDDALLLIGKSYFYEENFSGAEQKFREVAARGSDKAEEARFWLARTLVAAGDEEAANAALQEAFGQGGLPAPWDARLRLVEGELRVQQEDWAAAAAALQQGLSENIGGDRTAARAYFLLGQVRETMARYETAAQAYRRAEGERPRYELTYAAQVGAVRAAAQAGATGDALRQLDRLANDGKNRDHRAELALLRAEVLEMQGRLAAARHAYRALLYDPDQGTAAASSGALPAALRARAHYALAVLYRDDLKAYVPAAAHFDTAATSLGSPGQAAGGPLGRAAPRTPLALTDAVAQAEAFGELAAATQSVQRLDSLLRLGALSESDFAAFVEDLRRRRAREQEAQQRAEEERAAVQGFGDQFGGAADRRTAGEGTAASATGEAGFLFYRDPARVQQNRLNFVQRWGDRPRVPNWRRLEAITGASAQAPGTPATEAGPAAPDVVAGPAQGGADVSAVPRTEAAQAQMRAERAEARYKLANALFLAAAQPDSALAWYRRILDEDGEQPVARRAAYAIAEVERARGDTAAARRQYRRLIDRYPGTDLARRARRQLTGPGGAARSAPAGPGRAAPATARQAERSYERAYALWQRARYDGALRRMIGTAAAYQNTDVAPRALLAAASLYAEWARRDGFSLAAPLPLTLPDSLTRAGGLLNASLPDTTAPAGALSGAGEVPADTLASPVSADTMVARADSAALPEAHSGVPAAAPDPLLAVGTLLARSLPPAPGVRLETVLAAVIARYPETPYATRAQRMLQALEERDLAPVRRPVSTSPSAEERPAEERPVGAAATAPRRPAPRPSRSDSADRRARTPRGGRPRVAAKTALRGRGGLDPSQGGWTIVVFSGVEREARARADAYRSDGYRAGLVPAPTTEEPHVRVGLGQFADKARAAAALEVLAGQVPADSWLLELASTERSPAPAPASEGSAAQAGRTAEPRVRRSVHGKGTGLRRAESVYRSEARR